VPTCSDGTLRANGCNINTNTDATHCGMCSNACATGKSCVAGSCVTILVNGDFETGDFTGWTALSNPMEGPGCSGGNHAVPSYSSIAGPQHGSYFAAGSCGNPPGSGLEQTISVNPGQLYTVTGYYNAGGLTPSGGALYIDGTTIATAAFTDNGWHGVTGVFTPSTASVTFGFSLYNGPHASGWDNFSIV